MPESQSRTHDYSRSIPIVARLFVWSSRLVMFLTLFSGTVLAVMFSQDLTEGRGIAVTDRKNTLPVAVVNEAFAARFLPGQDPLGRRFNRGGPQFTIVGIVSNIRRDGKRAAITPQVYLPAAQTGSYPVGLSDFAVSVMPR